MGHRQYLPFQIYLLNAKESQKYFNERKPALSLNELKYRTNERILSNVIGIIYFNNNELQSCKQPVCNQMTFGMKNL